MSSPLIEVSNIWREFDSGGEPLMVLKGIDLAIYGGEMVAIMGGSGSGKSTLMNILGCLDKPTSGSYRINGRDVAQLHPDEVAKLRRKYFGFIFQRYHLLPNLSALGNVEIPALYDGMPLEERKVRAEQLLTRFGLGARMGHYPNQLSGGQQQRVSISRALMNGGMIILADEPTGALDEKSGIEVMEALRELSTEGHTIILVTHDPKVAENAGRIIHVKDGKIVSDRRTESRAGRTEKHIDFQKDPSNWAAWRRAFLETFVTSMKYMVAHPLRSFLTMLGIMIGIASVVSVVALGKGAQQQIMQSISAFGVNAFDIYPISANAPGSTAGKALTTNDFEALRRQPYVDSGTPSSDISAPLRYGNISQSASLQGVGDEFMRVKNFHVVEGAFFGPAAVQNNLQQIVLDIPTRQKLFGTGPAIGNVVFFGPVPLRVIGVIKKKKDIGHEMSTTLKGWVPYTTLKARMQNEPSFGSIELRAKDGSDTEEVKEQINRLIASRHGSVDVEISSSNDFIKSIKQTRHTTNVLISSVAVISLIVGGIGVMNIMLVAVIERTKEIGIRIAVGARQSDIMQQFLIEAVLVCVVGGIFGLILAVIIYVTLSSLSQDMKMIFSSEAVFVSVIFSVAIGVIFGFFPARNAARLDPVEALSRQ